jgi:glutathione S-transferase
MIKIFGADLSYPANKVRMVANALEIPFEYHRVNLMAGEHKTEAFLQMNPAGKVPVLKDGEFCLFESNAMCRYLARLKDTALFPKDTMQAALVDQWMEYISHHVGIALGKILYNTHFYTVMGDEKDERSLRDGHRFLDATLQVLNQQYSRQKYLGSNQMTIADICLVATLDPVAVLDFDISRYPAMVNQLNEIKAMKFYSATYTSFADVFESSVKVARS